MIQVPSSVLEIIQILKKAGFLSYLVGGCVRDALLGRTPRDWDVASSAHVEDLLKLFPDALTLGAVFGVVAVKTSDIGCVEIASFREDGDYLDGRHPQHIRYSDAQADAQRRDFTVNALFYDTEKQEVIDYVKGLDDLHLKTLRCVGNPLLRFQEDRLRMLRALRLSYELSFEIEIQTQKAIEDQSRFILEVSVERIVEELKKILKTSKPGEGFARLFESGLGPAIFSINSASDQVNGSGLKDFLSEKTVLFELYQKLGKLHFERLKWDKTSLQQMKQAESIRDLWFQASAPREGVLRETLFQPGMEYFNSWFCECKKIQQQNIEAWTRFSRQKQMVKDLKLDGQPLVRGRDLMAWGVQEGFEMKTLLKEFYYLRLEDKIHNLQEARAYFEQRKS